MRVFLCSLIVLAACGREGHLGKPPAFTPETASADSIAMMSTGPMALGADLYATAPAPSLWTGTRGSLLGDRRALQPGDILTVVIEIDDSAEISNTTSRGRSSSETMGLPNLGGIPQRLDRSLPAGATMAEAVSTNSKSQSSGNGSVRRNEKLTLRVAATVLSTLPNGVLQISGTQEVRVNFELRELLVSGYVRPADISRQNEITYDKIAAARISYGGRGQINDMQQPRYGQQVLDMILPF